jgi:hypothetical protein
VHFEAPPIENLPASHAAHVAAPSAEYLPASHCVHCASCADVAPGDPCLPAAQSAAEHADELVDIEYLPGPQSMHAVEAVVGVNFPAAQGVHSGEEPGATEYFPTAHSAHAIEAERTYCPPPQ